MKNFGVKEAKEAIEYVKELHGVEMAKLVEKIFRHETAHFKSGQYKRTGSAGMETGKWSYINPNEIEKDEVYSAHDAYTADGIDHFIVWKHPKYAANYLANYIKRFNGNYGRWFSVVPEKQEKYKSLIQKMKTKFV